jgi:phosphomannomutase/phosphoglucomutase
MSLKRWLVFLALGTQTVLVLTAAGGDWLTWQQAKRVEVQRFESYVSACAAQIQTRAQELGAWVAGLAQDPHLLAVFSGQEVKAEEQRLARLIPAAVQVRILPLEENRWQADLSFADLDLVRRAEAENPPLAVHGLGSSAGYVAVARAIKGEEGGPLGVLLVGISLDWLAALLPTPASGALGLFQGNLRLVYRGDAALQALPPFAVVQIPHTAWQLKYWTAEAAGNLWGNLALLALALAFISSLFWLTWRGFARALAQDQAVLFALVQDLFAGASCGNYSLKLVELEPLLIRLLHLQPPQMPPAAELETPTAERQGSAETQLPKTTPGKAPASVSVPVPEAIFKAAEILGTTESLTPAVAYELGRAIGSEASALGEQGLVVGYDARPASQALARALSEGLRASGRDVIDLGKVPTPMLEFATHYLPVRSGVMVTGGPHPPQYNGIKLVLAQEPWWGDKLKYLRRRLEAGELSAGLGMLESRDLLADYIGAIIDDVQLARPLKVIVDCGSGVAVQTVPALLRTLGCTVEESHQREMLDPFAPRALERLCAKVQKDPEAELGLAFSGDGGRLAVIDSAGNWILPDRVSMLLAADVLVREPGADIVFDVECGRSLASYILQHGGRPVMAACGSCAIHAKMVEVGAAFGGGFGGQLVFRERWFGVADAIYGAARLVEVLASEPVESAEIFAGLPQAVATPQLRVAVAEDESAQILRVLVASADKFFHDAKITALDGVRVDFADGWGSVRASRSLPVLVFRFEADDAPALTRIQARFREWFEVLELTLELPFGKENST